MAAAADACEHSAFSRLVDWKQRKTGAILLALNTDYNLTDTATARIFSELHPLSAAPPCKRPICPAYVEHLQDRFVDLEDRDGSIEEAKVQLETYAGLHTEGMMNSGKRDQWWTQI